MNLHTMLEQAWEQAPPLPGEAGQGQSLLARCASLAWMPLLSIHEAIRRMIWRLLAFYTPTKF